MTKNNTYFLPPPILFFTMGFIYYLIIPYIVLNYLNVFELTPVSDVLPLMDERFFNIYYFADITFILLSFFTGYKLSLCFAIKKQECQFDNLSDSNFISSLFFGIIVLLNVILIMNFKRKGGILFSGYQRFDISFLGQLSTITFLTFFFINFFKKAKTKMFFLLLVVFESIILLGLGTRNIVMNGTITAILGLLYFNKKLIFSLKFYAFIFSFAILILFIGIWRTGFELKFTSILGILFAEPVFVLSSASLYLEHLVTRPYIHFPYEVFISVINFIPTFIFPGKIDLLNHFMANIQHYSPFGALSVLVALYSNFGSFYFVYVMGIGALFGYLYRKAACSVFYRAIYFSAIPLIIFQFYNQFLYSFFKLLIWNAFIIPSIIFFIVSKAKKVIAK